VRVSVAEPRMSFSLSNVRPPVLHENFQPRSEPVSEVLKIQSSLANGDDKVPSLILIPATRRVGAMTDLLVTDSPQPLQFPKPQVTGVPIVPPALLRPSPRLQ
jgi:hypothetical protein